MAPAGLLAISGQYVESDLRQIKARTGLVIPENTVRKLSLVSDAAALERKMQRHSRNTEYLSDFMHRLAQKEGPLNEVVHPFLPTHPQHDLARRELGGAGGLFHLGIRDDLFPPTSRGEMTTPLHAAEVAEGFTKLVVLLARRMNVEICLGTSYGFSVTRMAVYQRNLTESAAAQEGYWNIPYIRVAPGTETMKDTHLLAAVMQRAYEILGEAHQNGTLLNLLESLNHRSLQVELQTLGEEAKPR